LGVGHEHGLGIVNDRGHVCGHGCEHGGVHEAGLGLGGRRTAYMKDDYNYEGKKRSKR
jgi:hypothetical protein